MNHKLKILSGTLLGAVIGIPVFAQQFYQCMPCQAGTYSSDGTCKQCSAGTYSSTGASSCTTCPDGTYQDASGQANCKPCISPGIISSDKKKCTTPCIRKTFYYFTKNTKKDGYCEWHSEQDGYGQISLSLCAEQKVENIPYNFGCISYNAPYVCDWDFDDCIRYHDSEKLPWEYNGGYVTYNKARNMMIFNTVNNQQIDLGAPDNL